MTANIELTDEEETAYETYMVEQAEAEDRAHIAHHGVASFVARLRYEQAEAAAYEHCLVEAFENDPMTRYASLDAGEKRPMVDAARARCAQTGCPLCNQTVGCYVCTREAGGDPFAPDSTHPQRRVTSERTVNPADPTTALTLECGHTII
jgi:hypothetical protein